MNEQKLLDASQQQFEEVTCIPDNFSVDEIQRSQWPFTLLGGQSSKEEHNPWNGGATTRYCASHTKTCYQQGSPYQDPAGNRTMRRPPDHGKEMQTAVVWSCLPFIRSGQNHLVKGGRRQGRQRKRWEDNIRVWTGLKFAKAQRVVDNRGKWRKLRNRLWCPNDPSS